MSGHNEWRDRNRAVRSGALRIGGFITRADNNGDLIDSGRERLLNQDSQQRLLVAVAVNKSLKRQRPLRARRSGYDCFLD